MKESPVKEQQSNGGFRTVISPAAKWRSDWKDKTHELRRQLETSPGK